MKKLTTDQIVSLKNRDAFDCSLVMMPDVRGWNDTHKSEEIQVEIKDRAHTLNAGTKMTYEKKIQHAKKVIGHALKTPGVKWSLSYSGGKDSTVLSHLMIFGMGIENSPCQFKYKNGIPRNGDANCKMVRRSSADWH